MAAAGSGAGGSARGGGGSSAASRWFFSREQLDNTPSRRCGVEADKELSYRQQAANLIQDMGQRLNVFYMHHSFTKFNRNIISPTALFLAAKVEEQPRKLEHVIKVVNACLHPHEPQLDTKCDAYLQQAQELVILETIMLQTLVKFEDVICKQGFGTDILFHGYQQYKPTVIACVCIHLACKWSNWEIPVSTDGKHWWEYVDPSVTLELLDELTHEFLQILEKTPSRLKRIRNWRANQAAKKPKGDGQVSENSLLGSSLVQNSILVDTVTGVSANTSFQKPSTSFPAPVPLTSGSISVPDSHAPENLAILATGMPSTSYNLASHQEWPQHQEQTRTEQIYSQKQEALPPSQYNMNFQQGPAVQLHPGVHHRPDKLAEHSAVKQEYSHKSGNKHHGQVAAPIIIPQKMSLDKYREKRKLETLELDVREHYVATPGEQTHKKHVQAQPASSTSVTSPIKMKIPIANAEKPEKHLTDKKEKSGSLKLRIPIPPTEKGASKEELKMKIKVSSSERHSSSDESSGKSKHSSPHVSKEHKEKHKEHSLNRHHSIGHKHSHSHSGGSSSGGSKHSTDGLTPTVLRSPVGLGLSSDGNSSSSSSSRKKLYSNDASHNHHSKMSKSSKSSGSSSSSSSVKQYVSSHNSVFNLPLPPPPPVTYQVGYGHLSTLVKLDRKPVENGPDASHHYSTNSQHMDYKDTFDMLDSLLSAQGMNT
ncbi:UNVERIFIED_CONTAM: hypothetical protein H355_016360 [Colinus virginianus]|nr:hypothetical protein H355_016360 [Colinus virginianus]